MIPPQLEIDIPHHVQWNSGKIKGELSLFGGGKTSWSGILLELEEESQLLKKGKPVPRIRILGSDQIMGPVTPGAKAIEKLPFELGYYRRSAPRGSLPKESGKWEKILAPGLDFLRTSSSRFFLCVYLLSKEGEPFLLERMPVSMQA